MASSNESKGPAILWLLAWWALATKGPFPDYAFVHSLVLMLVGWLAIRMFGNATARLGSRAWLLIVYIAVWFGLFLYFIPADPVRKLLTLWGIGIPLIFVGSLARLVYLRFPQFQQVFEAVPQTVGALVFIILPVASWLKGPGFGAGIAGAFLICALAAIPLYYGWQLAEPLPRGERDARFGTEEGYRQAGMSGER